MNLANVRSCHRRDASATPRGPRRVGARRNRAAGRRRHVVGEPSAVIAILPYGTTVEQIAGVAELAPGVVSAGLGAVPVAQTYLDISQGNRAQRGPLRRLAAATVRRGRAGPAGRWDRVDERAEDAPAQIVPGLLASTLEDARVPVAVEADSGLASLIGVDREGVATITDAPACAAGCGPGLTVSRMRLGELGRPGRRPRPGRPADRGRRRFRDPAGAAARGRRRARRRQPDLTVDPDRRRRASPPTSRRRCSSDSGSRCPTRSTGSAMDDRGRPRPGCGRRAPVAARPPPEPRRRGARAARDLAAGDRARGARSGAVAGRGSALRLLALSCAWAPLMLLLLAAPDAGPLVSALAVVLGAPLLAAATDRLLGACAGLALACGLTVGAYAVDVVAGLTADRALGARPQPRGWGALLRHRQRARGDPRRR